MRLVLCLWPVVAMAQGPQFLTPPQPVQWSSEGNTLAGGLIVPPGAGPHPAAILVHGSGPGRYDDPAFIVHANAFLEAGFAVLTYDKRGSGGSSGTLALADYDDLAGDLASAVQWLRRQPGIDAARIGLVGRSEGAWVSAIAASRDPAIAFVIFSSGSALPPRQQTMDWTRRSLQSHGATPSELTGAMGAKAALWDFYARVAAGSVSADEARVLVSALTARLKTFERFSPEIPQVVRDPAAEDPRYFQAFTRMISFDPAPAFAALRVPMLAVIGENDDVVEPASTIAAFEDLRQQGRDVTTRVFPGVGHSLLVMDGDRIVGYPDGYLELLTGWASLRIAPNGRAARELAAADAHARASVFIASANVSTSCRVV